MTQIDVTMVDRAERQIARQMRQVERPGAVPEWVRKRERAALRKRLRALRRLRTR